MMDYRKDSELRTKVYYTLLKMNNFIGFFPNNIEDSIGLLIKELEKLLAPGQVSFCFRKNNFPQDLGGIPFTGERYHLCQFSDCWIENHVLPIIVQDTSQEQGCPHHQIPFEGECSYACIPVVQEDKVIAILNLNHNQKDFFTREILEVLLVMANVAASTIHHWMLWKGLEREKRELEEANAEIRQLAENLENNMLELKRTQKQLIQSEKLAAMGRLAAEIAHEINNPISIITSRAECMLMEGGESLRQEFGEDIDVIMKQAGRVSRITRSLLSFTRLPAEEKTSINVDEIIEETVSLYQKHLQKKKISVWQQLSGVPVIWGNSNKIQQILVNLINNASDAMPNGGSLYLRAKADNGYVVIKVQDEGCGIPADQIDKIYDPFFTTKGKGLGTGLGLAVSYSFIQEHGGKVEVNSELGRGTCFTLTFPACDGGGENG